jgi:glycyl-tRNA synthetase beta chain
MKNFLFEIGVENIPARFITSACSQMKNKAEELFKKHGISYQEIDSAGTYKRLTLFVKDLSPKSEERAERFYGPSSKILKDESGNYTKQAEGFAKAHNISVDKLIIVNIEKKGEVLCVEKKIPSQTTEKILPEILFEITASLKFPKTMMWEESKFKFARPIRSLLAIYDKKNIPLKIADVKSSKWTFGPNARGFNKIAIKNANDYYKTLEKNHVIVKDSERKKQLIKEIKQLSNRMKFEVKEDEELIDENVYLSEYPVCVLVKFPNEFLTLPPQLLALVMKKQLKFFPTYDSAFKMNPYFIGIRDGISKGHKNVEEGFLSVFQARCNDALFFYNNDLSLSVAYLNEKIKNIEYQKSLGSVYDKKLRVKNNFNYLLEKLKVKGKEELSTLADYAYLDLATNIVREFPELQGTISYYYAKNWGLDERKAKILSEFYYPLYSKSELPSSLEAALLSVSAKIDTLIGDFALGMTASGSEDPHALRRSAYALIRIFEKYEIEINIIELLGVSFDFLPEEVKEKNEKNKLIKAAADFIWQRAESYFVENGYGLNEINSVYEIFIKEGNLILIEKRLEAIKKALEKKDFKNLSLLYKRVKNILKNGIVSVKIDESLFEKEEEKTLFSEINKIKPEIEDLLKNRDYLSAMGRIELLNSPLENFFNNVMVMTENEKVKNNRLSLLNEIYLMFKDISDISKL